MVVGSDVVEDDIRHDLGSVHTAAVHVEPPYCIPGTNDVDRPAVAVEDAADSHLPERGVAVAGIRFQFDRVPDTVPVDVLLPDD